MIFPSKRNKWQTKGKKNEKEISWENIFKHNHFKGKPICYLFIFSWIYLCRDALSHSKHLSEPNRLALLSNITDLLGRTFSSQFVFPVLGHEDVQNDDKKDYKSFLHSLGNIWRQWLPLEAIQTFTKGMGAVYLFYDWGTREKWWNEGFVVFLGWGRSGIYNINFEDALG